MKSVPTSGGSYPINHGNLSELLLADVRTLILESRNRVAQSVNYELAELYWQIGARVGKDILGNERADYGKQVVELLAVELTSTYGKGFSRASLFRMVQFAGCFPQHEIVAPLMRQLSWTHWIQLIALDDPLKREFYVQMCRIEKWSVRTLQGKIKGLLFERTALSRKPDELVRHELTQLSTKNQITPDLVFRDPYLLDFLGLADTYSERDLEAAILREIERFLLELGFGFSFVGRQKRISTAK